MTEAAFKARRPGESDDRALLERAAGGDELAVRELFRGHIGRMHRQAARILGADDPDVEDVVQQAFLAALDGAAKFDGRSSVATWLFLAPTMRSPSRWPSSVRASPTSR